MSEKKEREVEFDASEQFGVVSDGCLRLPEQLLGPCDQLRRQIGCREVRSPRAPNGDMILVDGLVEHVGIFEHKRACLGPVVSEAKLFDQLPSVDVGVPHRFGQNPETQR